MTTTTDAFRDAALQNLDRLGVRKSSLLESMRLLEEEHRARLAEALSPLEADLRDTNLAIYAQERMVGALPPRDTTFQDGGASMGNATWREAPSVDTGAADGEAGTSADDGSGVADAESLEQAVKNTRRAG